MPDAIVNLEERIAKFESLLEEMKKETREAHSTLKEIQKQRREIDKFLTSDIKNTVEDQIAEVIKVELKLLGEQVNKSSGLIYDKVGRQIDKLIAIALGKELSTHSTHADLRPILAVKLREFIQEIVETE